MKKEGSTASMLWLDICRGFCSKRFWGIVGVVTIVFVVFLTCLLYTSPSPRDGLLSRMPSSA